MCDDESVNLLQGCGEQIAAGTRVESRCNYAKVHFHTDSERTFRGFSITYWGVFSECIYDNSDEYFTVARGPNFSSSLTFSV